MVKVMPNINFSGDNECYDICILPDILDYKPVSSFSHKRVFKLCLNEKEQSKESKGE